jgi:alpha-beta hydrolase superfamily lysophospholipase
MPARAVVFLHGAFMTPLAWEHWQSWFESRGHRCLAPAWPGHDRKVADLRAAHPDPELARLRLAAIIDHSATEVAALDPKPIVIGHSMGGLVAQLLVNRDMVAAGVAIHSAPPARVFTTSWSYIRSR